MTHIKQTNSIQKEEKMVVQDWLDNNVFSASDNYVQPTIVFADVHCSSSGTTKLAVSDSDEDFVSVSQKFKKCKLIRRFKKYVLNGNNASNLIDLNVIEPYRKVELKKNVLSDQDSFDKIFHADKKTANIIQKTYPGKVKGKSNSKKSLHIYKDLFLSNSNEISQYRCLSSNSSTNKMDFSSGSDEVWSPKKYKQKFNTKKLNSKSFSIKICKKYSKKRIQKNFQSKLKIESRQLKRSSSVNKNNKYCRGTYKIKNDKQCSNFDLKNDIKNPLFVREESCDAIKILDIKKNVCIKTGDLSLSEYERLLNDKPIVLVKKLDINAQGEILKKGIISPLDTTHSSINDKFKGSQNIGSNNNINEGKELLLNVTNLCNEEKNKNTKHNKIRNCKRKIQLRSIKHNEVEKILVESHINNIKCSERSLFNIDIVKPAITDEKIIGNKIEEGKLISVSINKSISCINPNETRSACTNTLHNQSSINEENNTPFKSNTKQKEKCDKFVKAIFKKIPVVIVKPLKLCESNLKTINNKPKLEVNNSNMKAVSLKHNVNLKIKSYRDNLSDYFKQKNKDDINLKVQNKQPTPVKVNGLMSPGWSRLEETKKYFKTAERNKLSVTNYLWSRKPCKEQNECSKPQSKPQKIKRYLFDKETKDLQSNSSITFKKTMQENTNNLRRKTNKKYSGQKGSFVKEKHESKHIENSRRFNKSHKFSENENIEHCKQYQQNNCKKSKNSHR